MKLVKISLLKELCWSVKYQVASHLTDVKLKFKILMIFTTPKVWFFLIIKITKKIKKKSKIENIHTKSKKELRKFETIRSEKIEKIHSFTENTQLYGKSQKKNQKENHEKSETNSKMEKNHWKWKKKNYWNSKQFIRI